MEVEETILDISQNYIYIKNEIKEEDYPIIDQVHEHYPTHYPIYDYQQEFEVEEESLDEPSCSKNFFAEFEYSGYQVNEITKEETDEKELNETAEVSEGVTKNEVLFMIGEVRKRPHLWDPEVKGFANVAVLHENWKEISENMSRNGRVFEGKASFILYDFP